MKILIVEDEAPAAKRLSQLILNSQAHAAIVAVIDSVESSVKWLRNFPPPDLIFLDIQLADGLSFDIFTQVKIESPIIFTTAYDQYTLKAFKMNSVDYLLKPIDPKELENAFEKYKKIYKQQQLYDVSAIEKIIQGMTQKPYKERFLVKQGQQLNYISIQNIAYFFSEEGLVYAQSKAGKKHHVDYTLDQLETLICPDDFFRINRKIITHLRSIHKIHSYFNSRLKLELKPQRELEVIVSRDRVGDFKLWLDR